MPEIELKESRINPIFGWEEIKAVIHAEKTPSKEEAKRLLAEKTKKDPECILVKKIIGRFGRQDFELDARIYKTAEDKVAMSPKPKKDKKKS